FSTTASRSPSAPGCTAPPTVTVRSVPSRPAPCASAPGRSRRPTRSPPCSTRSIRSPTRACRFSARPLDYRLSGIYSKETCSERHPSPRRHKERRLHSGGGRQARRLVRIGTSLRRLGDLPYQGIVPGPEPYLRVAVEQLVRAGSAALERRR